MREGSDACERSENETPSPQRESMSKRKSVSVGQVEDHGNVAIIVDVKRVRKLKVK